MNAQQGMLTVRPVSRETKEMISIKFYVVGLYDYKMLSNEFRFGSYRFRVTQGLYETQLTSNFWSPKETTTCYSWYEFNGV
jgi:hypothetical protein